MVSFLFDTNESKDRKGMIMGNLTKQTERLNLRPLEMKDAPALLELLKNPRVSCFEEEKIETLDQARSRIENPESPYELAAALKDSDEFAGLLFGMAEGDDTYSVCWNFRPEYGGKGLAFEAAQAYLDWLFQECGFRRIYAYVETDNLPSHKLCQRLGMRQEGVFKEFISFVNNPDGSPKYEDTMQFAILKREWMERLS